jgi:hypothetical protein
VSVSTRGRALFAALVTFLVSPAIADAHVVQAPPGAGPQPVVTHSHQPAAGVTQPRALVTACTGAPMPTPDQVVLGEFGPELEGSYVALPFDVPAGTDAVRVKYCFDQPTLPDPLGLNRHTIDIGLYEPDENGNGVPDEPEFRGWGGSSRRDVTVSPEGTIDPDPDPVAGQKTTVGFLPGPIPAGEWAAELGVAAVADELPSEDGVAQWRVEIDVIDDPAFSDEPYSPAPYDGAPANPDPGWYAGDLHVHARHSAPGDATMRETFSYAFCPDPSIDSQLCQDLPDETEPGAGLDFITLSDYVTSRQWGEIGAFQADYPGHLLIRSAEVITYRGHVNNHASVDFADYRTGPIYERQGDGTLALLRGERPASAIFDEIDAAGGWAQVNHPETFPSEIPTFGNLCRGCSWEYSDEETDYSKVDAIEVATGPAGLQQDPNPGPNPFTPLAIQFWERGIDAGGVNSNHIAAVGSSDSHNAGRAPNPITQSPIGQATTVVYAGELSEAGIGCGVEAGHTYVKMWGNDGPDLRLEGTVPGSDLPPAIIGDTVEGGEVEFRATVKNLNQAMSARPGAYTAFVVRNGAPFLARPIPAGSDEFHFDFRSGSPARYRLQVDRTAFGAASVEAVSSPIYHQAGGGSSSPSTCPGAESERSRCSSAQEGTRNADKLVGSGASDRILGRGGRDRIRGRGGDDCLHGGPGPDKVRGNREGDRVRGGKGGDRLNGGAGRDRISGGAGSDVIQAAGGARDRVRCGGGRDKVVAGRNDRLRGCEVVR